MSKDFIHNNILQGVADAIRYCDDTTAGIAPSDFADRIRALDKYKPDFGVLNFTMPSGGTISLNKRGYPMVVELEYWLSDDNHWRLWEADSSGNRSLTLTAGQTMYVRNRSETSTRFSIDGSNRYTFSGNDITEAHGNINSLLCKNPNNAVITTNCFQSLFYNFNNLVSSPEFPATELENDCYRAVFENCSSLVSAPILPALELKHRCYRYMFCNCVSLRYPPELPALVLKEECYYYMFDGCALVSSIKTRMNNVTAANCITNWLSGVAATGNLYCPATLTLPVGASGIPSGWTRHDLSELS